MDDITKVKLFIRLRVDAYCWSCEFVVLVNREGETIAVGKVEVDELIFWHVGTMCQPFRYWATNHKDILTQTYTILIAIESALVYRIVLRDDKRFWIETKVSKSVGWYCEEIVREIDYRNKEWYDEEEFE